MKKLSLTLFILLCSACTISDTYYKPDVGRKNVGSVYGTITNESTSFFGQSEDTTPKFEKISDYCWYLLDFKMNSDCSPDMIANNYGLETITEINTQWQLFPFVLVQRTNLIGIPKEDK
ncbi:MAG: hypothetical protein IJ866_03795 [Alphaproteobacteria bacterium]|nr:hypothetical protein [Alphaproteobacteria bacterium]